MAPGVHLTLTLALLFFPSLILSESLHVPLGHRRQTKLSGNWGDEANKIRRRYGYQTVPSQSRRSNRRASSVGIPILDQVGIVIVFFFSHQLITRIIGYRF